MSSGRATGYITKCFFSILGDITELNLVWHFQVVDDAITPDILVSYIPQRGPMAPFSFLLSLSACLSHSHLRKLVGKVVTPEVANSCEAFTSMQPRFKTWKPLSSCSTVTLNTTRQNLSRLMKSRLGEEEKQQQKRKGESSLRKNPEQQLRLNTEKGFLKGKLNPHSTRRWKEDEEMFPVGNEWQLSQVCSCTSKVLEGSKLQGGWKYSNSDEENKVLKDFLANIWFALTCFWQLFFLFQRKRRLSAPCFFSSMFSKYK